MTDIRTWLTMAVTLALGVPASAEIPPPPLSEPASVDSAGLPSDWCHLDAPGSYARAREQARAGATLPGSPITCPPVEPAMSLPRLLVVPLPCDRAMTFAKVETATATLLDDEVVTLGGAAGDTSLIARYTQGRRTDTVAGAFTESIEGKPTRPDFSDLGARFYYFGAYEVTDLQYDLFRRGILAAFSELDRPRPERADALCAPHRAMAAETRPSKVLPATDLSWFDAVAFVRALNAYVGRESQRRIHEGRQPLIPWEQGSPGFLRLPSEEEWEFAARGGAASSGATGDLQTYLIVDSGGSSTHPGSINEVASYADVGTRSNTRGVGRKAPNLLGVYDVIGNVAEITHDLFRLTRPDRLQGVRGGYVLRGGHALTPTANLSVAHRAEEPFFDARGEGRTAFTGMRLVVVAPVFVGGKDPGEPFRTDLRNTEFDEALARAHEKLTASEQAPGAAYRRNARDLVSNLRTAQHAGELQQRLNELEASLEASEAELNSASLRELEEKIRAASIGSLAIGGLGRLAYVIRLRIDETQSLLKKIPPKDERRLEREKTVNQMLENWKDLENQVAIQIRYVLGTVVEISKWDSSAVDEAFRRLRAEFAAQKLDRFANRMRDLEAILQQIRDKPEADLFEQFSSVLDDNRDAREKRFYLDLNKF